VAAGFERTGVRDHILLARKEEAGGASTGGSKRYPIRKMTN
jgi:hypothetical protein